MNQPFYNDQAYIAESLQLSEDYIQQMARLASFKINSYKLSIIKASFCRTREDLTDNLNKTLFNFTSAGTILKKMNFSQIELLN